MGKRAGVWHRCLLKQRLGKTRWRQAPRTAPFRLQTLAAMSDQFYATVMPDRAALARIVAVYFMYTSPARIRRAAVIPAIEAVIASCVWTMSEPPPLFTDTILPSAITEFALQVTSNLEGGGHYASGTAVIVLPSSPSQLACAR